MLQRYFGENRFIQESFDKVYNLLPKWEPTEEDKELFENLISENIFDIDDKRFLETLKSMFVNKTSINIIREIAQNKGFENIEVDVKIAFEHIKRVYESVGVVEGSEAGKQLKTFLYFLIFEPMEYMRDIIKDIKGNNLYELENTLSDFIECGEFDVFDGNTPMIISFICKSDKIEHQIYTAEYKIIEFDPLIPDMDTNGNDFFANVIKSIQANKEKEFKQTGGGFSSGNNEIIASLKLINKLRPHWDAIVANNLTSSANKSIMRGIKNDINIDSERALNIYLGDYDEIENVNVGSNISDSVYNVVKNSLVIYPVKFNRLSEENKKKTATFLAKWRDNFNTLCVNSATNIFNNISAISNKLKGVSFDRINTQMAREFTQTLGNANIAKSVSSAYANIITDYNEKLQHNQFNNLTDKISWCCSFYAPIVESISNKLTLDNSISVKYRQYANKEQAMNILPLMQLDFNTMTGGNKEPKTIEKIIYRDVEKPVERIVEKPVERIIYKDSNNSTKSSTATGSYIENIIQAQKEFNKQYEQAYRDLIKSFVSVSADKMTIQDSKYFNCIYSLKSIGIESPKTTVYISGLYASKNWNKYYIEACKTTLNKLQETDPAMFANVISCVQRLISICEETAKKAQTYITDYMTATKSTSEVIGNINKVVKIPSRLSKEELNTYKENLQKLLSMFSSVSNESTSYSFKQQFDKYAQNVSSRSGLIRDYYRFKDEQAKLGASGVFNAGRLQMITQLNSQTKECMLYLNEVVDMKLTEYRQHTNDKNKFDEKMMEKFEKAMIQFKDMSNNVDLNKTLEKLKDAIYFERKQEQTDQTTKQERRMFNLLQLVQKFWKQSGYIDFVIQLYQEFGIFRDGFNWSQFKDNISLLLALVNITVSTQYNIKISIQDNPVAAILAGPIDKVDFGTINLTDIDSINTIAKNLDEEIHTKYAIINQFTTIQPIVQAIQQALTYSNDNNEFNISTLPTSQGLVITIHFSNKRFNFSLAKEKSNDNEGEYKLVNMVFDAMLVNVIDVLNKYAEIKYTGHFNLPIQVSTLLKGGNNEEKFEASLTNEEGKEIGGSIFDSLAVNDNNYDKVIDEAVPFYVCAFNILFFYWSKYHNKEHNDMDSANLFLNVSKISPLWPITSKIEAYNTDAASKLNIQVLKAGVGVFNTYWNKTTGTNNGEKLSQAIDMILNEINACMVYSTKLQYDAMRVTGQLPNNFLQSMQSNIDNLTKSLQTVMNESIVNLAMNNEQQTVLFENLMSKYYSAIKGAKDSEKLGKLLRVLTSVDSSVDSAEEVYKFIDLALMPLITTCASYNNIFSVFNLCMSTDNTAGTFEIDLSKYNLHMRTNLEGDLTDITAWDAIEQVKRDYNSADIKKATNAAIIKQFLETSPVVELWNMVVLTNHINDIVYKNKQYTIPDDMWFPIYVNTYPTRPKIASNSKSTFISDDVKLMLYQVYPFTAGNTLYDYFVTALSEFSNDIDHCLHLMLSYPGIHDKFIKSISSEVHKLVDTTEPFKDRFNISEDVEKKMKGVEMKRRLGLIKPPPYKNGLFLPLYSGDKSTLPSMTVYNSGEYITNQNTQGLQFLAVDGYNQNIIVPSTEKIENTIVAYSWTDWVIQKIADCDTTFSCIPFNLLQLLRSQSILSRKLQPLLFEGIGKEGQQKYGYTQEGLLNNMITGNIIARSMSQQNQTKSQDSNMMNKQWIANLVGLLPTIINKIKTYESVIDRNIKYYDVYLKSELSALSLCLITFYNDLISVCPKIGYMDNLTLFSNNSGYHAIAEIVPYIVKYNIDNVSSAEYSKFEWANKYFFGSIQELIFPEYQNFDRFGKIKKFASNVFSNSIFANEFDSVECILAKNLLSSSILLAGVSKLNNSPEQNMFKYILQAINLSGELAPDIAEKFVNNCIRVLRNEDITNKVSKLSDKYYVNGEIIENKAIAETQIDARFINDLFKGVANASELMTFNFAALTSYLQTIHNDYKTDNRLNADVYKSVVNSLKKHFETIEKIESTKVFNGTVNDLAQIADLFDKLLHQTRDANGAIATASYYSLLSEFNNSDIDNFRYNKPMSSNLVPHAVRDGAFARHTKMQTDDLIFGMNIILHFILYTVPKISNTIRGGAAFDDFSLIIQANDSFSDNARSGATGETLFTKLQVDHIENINYGTVNSFADTFDTIKNMDEDDAGGHGITGAGFMNYLASVCTFLYIFASNKNLINIALDSIPATRNIKDLLNTVINNLFNSDIAYYLIDLVLIRNQILNINLGRNINLIEVDNRLARAFLTVGNALNIIDLFKLRNHEDGVFNDASKDKCYASGLRGADNRVKFVNDIHNGITGTAMGKVDGALRAIYNFILINGANGMRKDIDNYFNHMVKYDGGAAPTTGIALIRGTEIKNIGNYTNMLDVIKQFAKDVSIAPIMTGGYNINDINEFLRVILSGIFDIGNIPNGMIPEITSKLPIEDSILLAAKMLNSINDFKIFPYISSSPYNPIMYYDSYNIVEALKRNDKVRPLTDFNKLYQYQPYNKDLTRTNNTEFIRFDNLDYYADFYKKYKNETIAKQLGPLFGLFDSYEIHKAGAALAAGDRTYDSNLANCAAAIRAYTGLNNITPDNVRALVLLSLKQLFGNHGGNCDVEDYAVIEGRFNKVDASLRSNNGAVINATLNVNGLSNAPFTTANIGFSNLLTRISNIYDKMITIAAPGGRPLYHEKLTEAQRNFEIRYAAYLSIINDAGTVRDLMESIYNNYLVKGLENNVINIANVPNQEHIFDILRGIILTKYIHASIYPYNSSFKSSELAQRTAAGEDIIAGFKDFGANGATISFIDNNDIPAYNHFETITTDISQFITTKPGTQPNINLSRADYIIRDMTSKYGVYSIINPLKEVMSTSMILVNNGIGIDSNYRSIKFDLNDSANAGTIITHLLPPGGATNICFPSYVDNAILRRDIEFGAEYRTYNYLTNIGRIIGKTNTDNAGSFYALNDVAANYVKIFVQDIDTAANCIDIIKGGGAALGNTINTGAAANDTRFATEGKDIFKELFANNGYNGYYTDTSKLDDLFRIINQDSTGATTKLNVAVPTTHAKISTNTTLINNIWSVNESPLSIGSNIINEIFNSVSNKVKSTTNTGFAFDVMNYTNMHGGFIDNSKSSNIDLIKTFIPSPDEIVVGASPTDTYRGIYKDVVINDNGKKKINNNYVGNSMFNNLFKFTQFENMGTDYMFALIINYFHKYTVSFNSIYNQVIFPSIIYNSAIFSTIAKKYSDVFNVDNDAIPSNSFTKFARNYLEMFIAHEGDNRGDAFNLIEEVSKLPETGVNTREKDMSYEKLATLCKSINDSGPYNPATFAPLTFEKVPSINDKFLRLLINKGFISNDDTANRFRTSSLIHSLKRIDFVETFVFVILLISKYMSYYNLDLDTDVPYSGQVSQEPFGYKFDI